MTPAARPRATSGLACWVFTPTQVRPTRTISREWRSLRARVVVGGATYARALAGEPAHAPRVGAVGRHDRAIGQLDVCQEALVAAHEPALEAGSERQQAHGADLVSGPDPGLASSAFATCSRTHLSSHHSTGST